MKRKRPALRRIALDSGGFALDSRDFVDASGGTSYSDIFEQSPALQKEVADAATERRRVQDCRFGSTSKDAGKDSGALVQTTRRKATYAGYR